jgi:hypothetical protein
MRDLQSGHPLERIGEGREAEIYSWRDDKVLRLMRDESGERLVREAAAVRAAIIGGAPVWSVGGTGASLVPLGIVFLALGLLLMRNGRRLGQSSSPAQRRIGKQNAGAGIVITIVGAIITIGTVFVIVARR